MRTMIASGILSNGPEKVSVDVEELIYRSYSYNRSRSPHVEPAVWRKHCKAFTEAMEARYQREMGSDKGAML